jgi:hypothetical protein
MESKQPIQMKYETRCKICNQRVEYDECEGNDEDGYICFECIEENKQ